ncbi:MAG TPA: hypothetical protein VJ788_04110, partial [Gemmatimonadota bacterium]|nr:hypothetical protein [Gemmatimonadota bacterium]
LAACSSDGGGPTPPDGSIVPAAIQAQIDALFPAGHLNDTATGQVEDVLESADAGQTAQAQTAFVGFVAFGAQQANAGALLDPGGAAPPTTEVALADLADDVADEAGLTIPTIPASAFGETGAAAVLGGSGGTVVTGDGNAGLQLPAGALSGNTLITIEPIPATGDPADHDGPLPTALDQYPRFYRIETFPPISTLGEDGIVGVCVVDPPDPFAPTPEVAARLRVAHPDPDDPQSIEILPLANAPFLDCDGGSGSLSPAAPGAIGGRISAFSPFAAVDPAGSPPRITSVTPNPVHASTVGGTETPFDVGFADPDGDVAVFRVIEISDPNNALEPGEFPIDDLAIGTSGSFTLSAGCGQAPPASCQTGTVVVDFVLIDAAGNESEPFRVTVVFE